MDKDARSDLTDSLDELAGELARFVAQLPTAETWTRDLQISQAQRLGRDPNSFRYSETDLHALLQIVGYRLSDNRYGVESPKITEDIRAAARSLAKLRNKWAHYEEISPRELRVGLEDIVDILEAIDSEMATNVRSRLNRRKQPQASDDPDSSQSECSPDTTRNQPAGANAHDGGSMVPNDDQALAGRETNCVSTEDIAAAEPVQEAKAAPPPAQAKSSSSKTPLVVGATAVLVALIAAAALLVPGLVAKPPADPSEHPAAGATSTTARPAVEPAAISTPPGCTGTLKGIVDSVTIAADGDFAVGLTLSANCPMGRLVDTPRLDARLLDADGLAAEALFDLSKNPVFVGPTGASLELRFRPGCYWLDDDTLPSSLVAELSEVTPSPQTSDQTFANNPTIVGTTALSNEQGENRALQQLRRQAAADRTILTSSYYGAWVPQLSSKRVGLSVNGTTYTNQKIWYSYIEYKRKYGDVLLVWSGHWQSFRYKDYWVVIASKPFSDADRANAWCDSYGFAPEDCQASKISDSEGPDGMSKQR